MLTTVERVILLRDISFFAECEDAVLADLAGIMEEEEARAGDVLMEQGDEGSSLYVIVRGEAEVVVDGETVRTLGERSMVGELAALDPEPRTATIRARGDLLALTLDNEALFDLLQQVPGVARGIIRFLCRRQRGQA